MFFLTRTPCSMLTYCIAPPGHEPCTEVKASAIIFAMAPAEASIGVDVHRHMLGTSWRQEPGQALNLLALQSNLDCSRFTCADQQTQTDWSILLQLGFESLRPVPLQLQASLFVQALTPALRACMEPPLANSRLPGTDADQSPRSLLPNSLFRVSLAYPALPGSASHSRCLEELLVLPPGAKQLLVSLSSCLEKQTKGSKHFSRR